MAQYYTNSISLEKLLAKCNEARVIELGKHAAAEYERVAEPGVEYLQSVKRHYQSSSIITTLKPLSLFLKIDPLSAPLVQDPKLKAREFAQMCLKHNFDGIVIADQREEASSDNLADVIREIRKFDVNN